MCVCVCVTGWTGCEVDGRMSGLVHRQTDKYMCVCVCVTGWTGCEVDRSKMCVK